MSPALNIRLSAALSLILLCSGCAGKMEFKSTCSSESDEAWKELSLAKAKGFAGTLSYTEALSLLTAARTMQTLGNYSACYNNAKKARVYIHNSTQGK